MIKNIAKVGKRKGALKSEPIRKLLVGALDILESVGVPLDDLSVRRLEKMAMSFLAVCLLQVGKKWSEAKSIEDGEHLRTREIITYINQHFEEDISLGSYDDIRRKDLVRLVGMGLVTKSANKPDADTNDGTRGYAVEASFASLVQAYDTDKWTSSLDSFEVDEDYLVHFEGKRELQKLSVQLEEGVAVSLDDGPHNQIQKAVVEEFLPNYGYNATVLYLGDTSEKLMHKYSDRMVELGLNIEDRGMLPDIIAFSEGEKWLYLIEAVHSSNPLNPERCIELQRTILKNCPYGVVYVTAFLTRKDFIKWAPEIAWETEVWLADKPEHMIHFNGDKFFGPHNRGPST